jgi:hypothetical protein
MSLILFADNASTTLASGITTSDTTIVVAAGTGIEFPAPGAGQIAYATLEDVSGNIEVVKITSRTTDSFVVVRGQDSTTPKAFASGTQFEQRVTAGILAAFLQKSGGDTLSGTTNLTGVLQLGGGGSVQGGEVAGSHIRSQPGDTSNEIFVPIGAPARSAGSPILTTANFLSNLPSGVGAVITGMVLLWSGTSGSIPTGYHLCDGTSGTPDLRDFFVLGAGGSLPTTGGSASTTTGSSTIGALAVGDTALSVAQLPAHHHTLLVGQTTTPGGGQGPRLDWFNAGSALTNVPAGPNAGSQIIGDTGTGATHTHSLSGSSAHAHSYSLPPYKALFYIMKL